MRERDCLQHDLESDEGEREREERLRKREKQTERESKSWMDNGYDCGLHKTYILCIPFVPLEFEQKLSPFF